MHRHKRLSARELADLVEQSRSYDGSGQQALAKLTREVILEMRKAGRLAWALVGLTIALIFVTLPMAIESVLRLLGL